jgi:hypothetical protein
MGLVERARDPAHRGADDPLVERPGLGSKRPRRRDLAPAARLREWLHDASIAIRPRACLTVIALY